MRPTSPWLLVPALLFALGAPAKGLAQGVFDGVDTNAPDDSTDHPDESAVVREEPNVGGRNALAYNAEILDELLSRSSMQTIREQKFAAAAGITGGIIMLGLGAWRLIEDEPQSQFSRGLGVMFMTLGMADLTTGIFAATRISHEEQRIKRWEKARKDGITAVELAHFEGELRSSHETRQGERLLLRWNGVTHALAGVLVIGLTPVAGSASRTDRVSGYVIGGIFTAIGIGTFAATFRGTPSEKAWNEYSARKMPMPGHEFSWGIAPSFSRRGVGLSFGGRF